MWRGIGDGGVLYPSGSLVSTEFLTTLTLGAEELPWVLASGPSTILSIRAAYILLPSLASCGLSRGMWWGRRTGTCDGIAVAGRNVGTALDTATAVATWITSNTTMLAPLFAYYETDPLASCVSMRRRELSTVWFPSSPAGHETRAVPTTPKREVPSMRNVLLISTAVIQFTLAQSTCATEQTKDHIVIDGRSFPINQKIMRGLWRRHSEEPDGRGLMPLFEFRSTANRRGYWAEFKIRNGELYLSRIEGRIDGRDRTNGDIISKPFPVRADWYTGSIFVSVGGFGTREIGYRYVIEFSIEKGKVAETRYRDARQIPSTWNGIDRPAAEADAAEASDPPLRD
jgi:hypothetical protein